MKDNNNILKLKSLDLSNIMFITSVGWSSLSTVLRLMAIKDLKLCNRNIKDGGAILIVSALVICSALMTLDMKTNQFISLVGRNQCFGLMINSKFSLEIIFFSHNNLDVLNCFLCLLLKSRYFVDALFLDCNNIDDDGEHCDLIDQNQVN